MLPKDIVLDLKNEGASRKVINNRLKELNVGFIQRIKLLRKTKRGEDDLFYKKLALMKYSTILIIILILSLTTFYYYFNSYILYTTTLYLIYFNAVLLPLTLILRLMSDSFTKHKNTYTKKFAPKDFITTILITLFVIFTNYHAAILPYLVGIPILVILIIFYDMTPTESFITSLTMGAYIYLLTTIWYYVNPYIKSTLSAILL